MFNESRSIRTDRRTFIAATSVGIVGLAAPAAFGAQAVAEAPMVAIGFAGGIATVARRGGARQALIAAESLTTSDPSLIRSGARISVVGLWQRPEMRGRRGSYAVEVNYSVDGLAEKVPFYAWTHAVTAKGDTGSSRASFVAPVYAGGSVDFVVRRNFGNERAAQLSFAVTSKPGAYMLDRGAYVIAFLEAGDALPDWRSIELVPGATALSFGAAAGLIRVRGITGSMAPSFDYLVVTFGSNVPEVSQGDAEVTAEPQTES